MRLLEEARLDRDVRIQVVEVAGEDLDIIMRLQRRGLADIDEALFEAMFIVRSCWPEIIKIGTYLQTHHELTFPHH